MPTERPTHSSADSTPTVAPSLHGYAVWASTRWVPPQLSTSTDRFATRMVMSLGLAGEAGEVAEVVEAWARTGERPQESLLKELGDVIYYWARLTQDFALAISDDEATPAAVMTNGPPPLLSMLRLVKCTGHVAEVFKKYVRDGQLHEGKLEAGLAATLQAWKALCADCGFSYQEVLLANQQKIESRRERGTTRGSGDNR